MEPLSNQVTYEAQIRSLMEDRARAIRIKDIEAALDNYAPDVLSFDIVDPLQYGGSNSIRNRLEEWFLSFKGNLGYDMSGIRIAADTDLAFCHCLCHVQGTKTDEGKLDMWWRETVCYQMTNGKWMITHTHSSVPFNVKSGKASLNLKPIPT